MKTDKIRDILSVKSFILIVASNDVSTRKLAPKNPSADCPNQLVRRRRNISHTLNDEEHSRNFNVR